MAFGQVFKKRGVSNGDTGNSDLETSEEKTKIPDIGGIMGQINSKLNETSDIIVREEPTLERGPCLC